MQDRGLHNFYSDRFRIENFISDSSESNLYKDTEKSAGFLSVFFCAVWRMFCCIVSQKSGKEDQ